MWKELPSTDYTTYDIIITPSISQSINRTRLSRFNQASVLAGISNQLMEANLSASNARNIIQELKSRDPLSLKKPSRPWNKSLTDQIANLGVHPAIESGLHILNDDLESAHFVCLDLALLHTLY